LRVMLHLKSLTFNDVAGVAGFPAFMHISTLILIVTVTIKMKGIVVVT
jgi:hypothetical protein